MRHPTESTKRLSAQQVAARAGVGVADVRRLAELGALEGEGDAYVETDGTGRPLIMLHAGSARARCSGRSSPH